MSDRVKILLADDHTIVRQGLKLILSAHADMEVVGEAADGLDQIATEEEVHIRGSRRPLS